ncbi:MAG: hypothetical protein GF365_05275 [Candidatus Buchananbacteria bacterium]|nr:hypothetical protein [Candidatus Buchananbacteria bacterium]
MKMKLNKEKVLIITRDLFITLFILFIFFSFLELLKPKIILNYIDLDLYLLVLILLGIITALYSPLPLKENKLKFYDYLTIFFLAILIGFVLIYLTSQLGYLSVLIGLSGFIICFFFIILIFKGR